MTPIYSTEIEDRKGYYHLDQDVEVYHPFGRILIPRGFEWNLASCPGWSKALGFSKGDPHTLLASLVHDAIYTFHSFTRAQADQIYYDLSIREGFAKWRAKIEYAAVRIAGGSYWVNDEEDIKLIRKWCRLWQFRSDWDWLKKFLKIPKIDQ